MGKLFGTDGVRGLANAELTPELAFKLGRAAGALLQIPEQKAKIVVGRDTRLSGQMLEAALAAGFCSAGVDVYLAGIIPTPAVAYLARTMDTCAGAVISASHNPAPDNGIKFFNHQGFKLADELEERIEELVLGDMERLPRPTGENLGRIIPLDDAGDRYVNFLKGSVTKPLSGLKIVVDCANGAAYKVAPRVYEELGAQVVPIYNSPDGININQGCGSTHPEALQEAVVKYGADLGLAHDGDADRVMAVDEKGQLVDGDQIMVICGLALNNKKLLGGKIVVTVMSNLGLKKAFEPVAVEVLETKVGDRYVLEKMQESGAILGGEQSGHIIFLDRNTTGDGLYTALQLLQVFKESGQPLSRLAAQMQVFPQVLVNVRVKNKNGWEENPRIKEAIAAGEAALKGQGRLLVRASGTEQLIRIMAEGPQQEDLQRLADEIAKVVSAELG